MGIETLIPRKNSPPSTVEAEVASNADDVLDEVYVKITAFDGGKHLHGPCGFIPRATADGIALPQTGDFALVSIDESGEPQIVYWEGTGGQIDYAPPASMPEASRPFWAHGGDAICENFPHYLINSDGGYSGVSGDLILYGDLVIPKGKTASKMRLKSGTTAMAGPSNWYFCIVTLDDLTIRAITADQLTTAWPATTWMELNFGAPYTPTEDTPVYFGIMINATTLPTLRGWSGVYSSSDHLGPPATFGRASAGETTPFPVGEVLNPLNTGIGLDVIPYCNLA